MDIYEKYCLNFQSTQVFFYFFCFGIRKMGDSKYNMDIYKSVKISIGTLMKNPEMSKFVLYLLENKKMCKHAVKKITFRNKICS